MRKSCSPYRSAETEIKLQVEPPKFEYWAGFRTFTFVIYGDSETLPLQITCLLAHRSAETEIKLQIERPKFEFLKFSHPYPRNLHGFETLPLQITCQIAYRNAETEVKLQVERPKFEF